MSIAAPLAKADVTLTDQNTSITIDPNSQAGVKNWTVDGVNNLFQQWFWYRINDDPTGQHSVDTIGPPVILPFLGTRGVDLTYTGAFIKVEVNYDMTGGAPGSFASDLEEVLRITNMSQSAYAPLLPAFGLRHERHARRPDGDSRQPQPGEADRQRP
jgi:hypothetical protein